MADGRRLRPRLLFLSFYLKKKREQKKEDVGGASAALEGVGAVLLERISRTRFPLRRRRRRLVVTLLVSVRLGRTRRR